jgi:hypothetical protein
MSKWRLSGSGNFVKTISVKDRNRILKNLKTVFVENRIKISKSKIQNPKSKIQKSEVGKIGK